MKTCYIEAHVLYLQSVKSKIDTLIVICDWYKFPLLAAITEATQNLFQLHCVGLKVNPL